MKNNILLAAALGFTLSLGACSDDEAAKSTPAEVGDLINFTTGLNKDKRTYYMEEDGKGNSWNLSWEFDKDKVRVFSQQATGGTADAGGGYYSDYTIAKYKDAEPSTQGVLTHDANGLKWSEGITDAKGLTSLHHFYAAYPADADHNITCVSYTTQTADNAETAVFKCPFSYDQHVQVETTANASTGIYAAKPDTKAQYMFASADGDRIKTTQMDFTFHPVMTTLDIVVENPTTTTATVIGIVVKAQLPKQMASDGYFYFKHRSGGDSSQDYGLCDNAGTLYNNWSDDAKTTTSAEFVATVNRGNKDNAVELSTGQSVTLTVFLPPIDLQNVEFTINGVNTGGITAYKIENTTLEAGSKKKTKAVIDLKKESYNWISFLDDDIYLQQLSLPGSNDAISYLASSQKTQSLSIIDQLNMGIRAFDVQVVRSSSSTFALSKDDDKLSGLEVYKLDSDNKPVYNADGTAQTQSASATTLNNLLANVIAPWLKENPNELVIISFKNNGAWDDFADALKDVGTQHLVQWNPQLTVGDCRGKVVYLTRYSKGSAWFSDFTNYSNTNVGVYAGRMYDNYDAINSTTPGSMTLFRGNYRSPDVQTTLYYFAKNSGSNYASNAATRLSYIQAVLNKAKSNASGFPWSICYIAGSASRSDNTEGYKSNASNMHPSLYNWIQEATEFGPMGIMFMDYVGVRSEASYPTMYGDLLPAAIIHNNFRAKLNRKP